MPEVTHPIPPQRNENPMNTSHALRRFGAVASVAAACLAVAHAEAAPEAKVAPLMSKDLADLPGKEGLMITVDYPPGAVDPVHRHNAHAFLYVLEGSIVMQLKGQAPVTLKAGDSFYEGVNDIHLVGRNASDSAPARFVVVLLKKKGAPVLTPVAGQ